MSFQPVIPFSGLGGWSFLQRTGEAQQESFSNGSQIKRETEYFQKKIKAISSAADLVKDPVLLKITLGAFGLQDDIGNKYYIQKLIEDGTTNPDALANRLSDKRYRAFSDAMGLSVQNPVGIKSDTQINRLVAAYETRSFEIAVGEQDPNLRLSLALERGLADIAAREISNDAKWFSIMGTPPLRQVFEGAFQLPSAFGSLPIDKQLETLKDRAQSQFGTDQVSELASNDNTDALRQRFLLLGAATSQNPFLSGSVALSLLQSSTFGSTR